MADDLGEIKRHFDTVAEHLVAQVQQVAEGVLGVDEKLGRFQSVVERDFDEVKAMMKLSFVELDRRVSSLESTVVALSRRLERLETSPPRVD